DLDLDNEDIEIIRKNKVAGQAFLLLTEKNLIQNGLPRDPVKSITYLIETLKEYK
ncbi:6947_t:CDS:1, partial [Rhizophagus irregularis]